MVKEIFKLIKTNRRTCLHADTLDDLIQINVEGPPLSKWDSSVSLDLRLKDKARRLNRKESRPPTTSVST